MKQPFDSADREILEVLQVEGRITNADLARKVGLSPPSTLQRVRKLEQKGIITGYAAQVSPIKIGYGLVVIAMIGLSMHQDKPIEEFVSAIQEMPEVVECFHVSGDFDFMLKVVAADMIEYERFIREKLSCVKSVGKIHSCFVLSTSKEFQSLPIPGSQDK